MQIMGVVVMVVINRQALCVLSEQLDESRIAADLLGMAGTADVTIEADHLIGGAHDQMQIVGNHQHAATVTITQTGDKAIEFGLPGYVDALHRLIKHQQFRLAQ